MRYFSYLSEQQQEEVFFKQPTTVTKYSSKDQLEYALGATLYIPGNRVDTADLIITRKYKELCSLVLCLEDSIGDAEVSEAEANVIALIKQIYKALQEKVILLEELPLMFIRVRTAEQMSSLAEQLGESIDVLTGFVFPKFSTVNGRVYLGTLMEISELHQVTLYAMPILETPELLDKQTRIEQLIILQHIFAEYNQHILNIRIGATDLCGLYGIRRNSNTTIYDISMIRDLIADIINLFGKNFVISGPVWEYFESSSRILKPQLRQSPFKEFHGEEGLKVRSQLINDYVDGLIKETLLDLSNGLNGKTVIHPTHLKIVQSLYVVSKEEYLDALSITENADGRIGVVKSTFSNKMNEVKPHFKWAKKIIHKSNIYGVYHENHSFIDLLTEPAYTTNL